MTENQYEDVLLALIDKDLMVPLHLNYQLDKL